MAILNMEDLKPGMILAENAIHFNGRVLLKAGSTLNEKHIMVFQQWGLTQADICDFNIDDINKERTANISDAAMTKAINEMTSHFRHVNLTEPVIDTLFKLAVEEHAKQNA